jgi:hypothetical protein
MSWGKISKPRLLVVIVIMALFIMPEAVNAAAESSSSNYQVNEVFFGSGGALNDCSASYCAKEAIGETAVGTTKSSSYQAHAGFNTYRQPYLQFIVNGGTTNVGVLSTGTTTATTATFSVKAYLSSGYSVVTVGVPPTYNTYNMHALSTPTASALGTEQFGMNLVQNSCPGTFIGCTTTLGANPNQNPSSTYSFGQAATSSYTPSYNTPNEYAYVNGSTIAFSNSSSGETDYTISYIYNISNTTPGGYYTFNDTLVATATF